MNKIFAALDGMEIDKAINFIDPIKDKLYGVKINHTLLPNLYEFKDYKVFVDLKLYDIPNTVETVIKWLIKQNVYMTTVHFENGEKCIEQISTLKNDINIAIVSHLTSFSANWDKQSIIYKQICDNIMYYNFNVVLSPLDLSLFNHYDKIHSFKRICPGIRLKESDDDQVRISTPEEAISNGADYLVIGRPLKENPIECFL